MGGLLILLQVTFILLKLMGVFAFSWWWVFSPMIFIVGYYIAANLTKGACLLLLALWFLSSDFKKRTRRASDKDWS